MGETKAVVHDWRDIFRAFKMAFYPKKMFLLYLFLFSNFIFFFFFFYIRLNASGVIVS